MDDDFNPPHIVLIARLSPEDMRDLVRASLTEALAKDREMRKLELLSSLKAEPVPTLPWSERAALAWRVLRGVKAGDR